jgi:hypothetical protein
MPCSSLRIPSLPAAPSLTGRTHSNPTTITPSATHVDCLDRPQPPRPDHTRVHDAAATDAGAKHPRTTHDTRGDPGGGCTAPAVVCQITTSTRRTGTRNQHPISERTQAAIVRRRTCHAPASSLLRRSRLTLASPLGFGSELRRSHPDHRLYLPVQ